MSKRTLSEVEAALANLKKREAALKEELLRQRKAAEIRATKERNQKVFRLAETLIEKYGEDVLEHPELVSYQGESSLKSTEEYSFENEGLPKW